MLCEIRVCRGGGGVLGKVRQKQREENAMSLKSLNLQTEGIKLWVTGSASLQDLEEPSPNSG